MSRSWVEAEKCSVRSPTHQATDAGRQPCGALGHRGIVVPGRGTFLPGRTCRRRSWGSRARRARPGPHLPGVEHSSPSRGTRAGYAGVTVACEPMGHRWRVPPHVCGDPWRGLLFHRRGACPDLYNSASGRGKVVCSIARGRTSRRLRSLRRSVGRLGSAGSGRPRPGW